jgi:DNA-directed RNA polymerase subunit RPC12/RpoP
MTDTRVTAICEKCGKTFETFLEQMAEHNQKVVCPECRESASPNPGEPAARKR